MCDSEKRAWINYSEHLGIDWLTEDMIGLFIRDGYTCQKVVVLREEVYEYMKGFAKCLTDDRAKEFLSAGKDAV